MASIHPPASNSMPLVTPGYPMVVVAHSNPIADVQLKEGTTGSPATSTALKTSLVQSGHGSDRID